MKFIKFLHISLNLLTLLVLSVPFSYAQKSGSPFGNALQNPSISAVGTFLGRYYNEMKKPYIGLSDAEIGFQAPVDPFSRFDLLLHYSSGNFLQEEDHEEEEGHEHGSGLAVEEALITLTSLPGRMQLSAGRMRSLIGLSNVIHLHDFNFTSYPEIITRYFGEEGLSVDGIRLSWLSPLPFWAELIFEGNKTLNDEDTDFATGGIKLFFPMGDDYGLSLSGFTYMDKRSDHNPFIENDVPADDYALNAYGGGFRFKWKPYGQALYKHFILQCEIIARKTHYLTFKGYYLFGEYMFTRGWTTGVMGEIIGLPVYYMYRGVIPESKNMQSVSVNLSYMPSHFQRLRLQYTASTFNYVDNNTLTLQWVFLIGPHKPHAY